MRRYLYYFWYVVKHKWYVLLEGLKLGVPIWQLVIHDWTKFTPAEFVPYARTFRTPEGKRQYIKSDAYYYAVNHHHKRNKHHWQYWVLAFEGEYRALDIPMRYRKEMLADWRAAGRALGQPDTKKWYLENRYDMLLSRDTRAWVAGELGVL